MRYTLRQLEVFLAASDYENITLAAKSLSMSQSAASAALKDLEDQFSIQLFDRVGKKIQVNEQGRLIRPRAQALLERAKELERSLIDHNTVGFLKVGATLTIGNYLAVELIAQFMQQSPGAYATLEVANTATITQQILNFTLDVGLIEGELQNEALDIEPWRDDELVVFCSPSHPWAKLSVLNDEHLQKATWILREEGSGTRQAFDRAMQGVLPRLNVAMELQHTEAIKRAVEANLGISCLSEIALKDAFERGTLVPLSVPHRDLHRKLYLVVHKQKYRSEGIQRWLDLCEGWS